MRTTSAAARRGSAPQITTANVPPISQSPTAGNQITFTATTVTIPD